MILSSTQIVNNSIYNADICIIGGGPAAISIALELKDTSKNIIMITGGERKETSFNQDLNRGMIGPNGAHEPLEENRRRQFGGASSVWGGRCIPLDPIDFEQRSWIPYSGWPLSYKDLVPYYEKAMKLCLAGNFPFNAHIVFQNAHKEIIFGLDDRDILSWPLEKWSPPINFAEHYEKVLDRSVNIQILLNTNVTNINCIDEKQKINNVTAVTGGKHIRVNAGVFILATGAIENARLLLASKCNLHLNGIGNDFNNVGKYYMSHINGTFAELDLYNRNKLYFDFERDNGVYCRRRWWISEEFQKQNQTGNIIMFLHHPDSLNGHRDALFSSVFLTKSFLSIIKQKSISKVYEKYNQLKPAVKEHTKNVLANGISMIPQIALLACKRFSKRRLPYILPSINSRYLGLYFQSEHTPNPESRVTISNENLDALGVPRAIINVAFSDVDIQTIVKAHQVFIDKYKSINAGNFLYDEKELYEYVKNRIKNFNSAAHHLGTTRMSDAPLNGVVDCNSKVFGIDNLYIAGSLVFPTGGHANPTLTIVALAVRLADYLKNNLR